MRLVPEANRRGFELAASLDENAFVPIDEDVADGRILEQGFERPQSDHLVDDLRDELDEFLCRQRQPLADGELRDDLMDLRSHLVDLQFFHRSKIEFLDQLMMQAHLGIEQRLPEQYR